MRERLGTGIQHVLPQHGLSRLVHALTRWRARWWTVTLIRAFVRHYGVDLSAAANSEPAAYETFNAFFTRALAPGARPLAEGDDTIACPADATISEIGQAAGDTLVQAKGRLFTIQELLAGSPEEARAFAGGACAVLYLSPRDYHRVHMPLDGTLTNARHVPGRLFSVNAATARAVPGLYARNERVVALFDTAAGPMAVVLVGALCVGSIEMAWGTPASGRGLRLARGAELGRFNMGSTVVLLFARDRIAWIPALSAGAATRMGMQLGTCRPAPR